MSRTAVVREQSQALQILANKSIMHPALIKQHFEAFTKMTDRGSVKIIMSDFIKTCAYLGYTDDYDMLKLTQIFRRIYKKPQDVEDISTLLDFALLLALSNSPYKDEFDQKSVKFIEASLSCIDDYFKGFKKVIKEVETEGAGHEAEARKVSLNYYESIKSGNKTFNKVMVRKPGPSLDAEKIYDVEPISSVQPFPSARAISRSREERIRQMWPSESSDSETDGPDEGGMLTGADQKNQKEYLKARGDAFSTSSEDEPNLSTFSEESPSDEEHSLSDAEAERE